MQGRRRSSLSAFKNDSRLHIEKVFDKSKSHHSQDFCVVYTFQKVFFQPFLTQWNAVLQQEVELSPWDRQKRRIFQVVSADVLLHQTPFEN